MRHLIILTMIAITFASCKKEEIINSKIQSAYLVDKFQAEPTKTALTSCAYDLNGKNIWGVLCHRCDFRNQCPKVIDCTPVKVGGNYIELKKLLELGFTEETLTKWITGENIIINEKEFFEKYYDFFLKLHNEGIIFHPDEIIKDYTNN